MTTGTGQCDCCGADNVELSFSVVYGIETWSCAEGCGTDRDKQHAKWAALADDPEATAIVDNWLSGFGERPLQLSQLQKDWLVGSIAASIQRGRADCATARRMLLYAARGGNADKDNPALLRFIADRLVHVYGESPGTDFVLALRERATMIETAIRAEVRP